MSENPRIREAMDSLLTLFKEENLEIVARAVFRGNEIPSDKWSFANRLLMFLNGTDDARGFKQWKRAGRNVKKGCRAFYILGPVQKKVLVEVKKADTGEKAREERIILAGFKTIPVFRIEDTEGEPVIRERYKVDIPYEFNGIIQELGLKIGTMTFRNGVYGHYSPSGREIRLATPEIKTFLHELSHAVDDTLHGLKGGQRADQEVTAEFSAAVIAQLMGYRVALGNVREYIEHYSFKELMNCLGRIEKVVSYIIERTTAGLERPVVCSRGGA